MFSNFPLKLKLGLLGGQSFLILAIVAGFSIWMLRGSISEQEANIARLELDIQVMEQISTMGIALLKEAKLAKDVWLRGATPEKIAKYRAEFLLERKRFEENADRVSSGLTRLALGHEQEFKAFMSRLDEIRSLHARNV